MEHTPNAETVGKVIRELREGCIHRFGDGIKVGSRKELTHHGGSERTDKHLSVLDIHVDLAWSAPSVPGRLRSLEPWRSPHVLGVIARPQVLSPCYTKDPHRAE